MGNRFDCKRLVERNEIFSNAFKIPNNTYTTGGISYNQNVNSTPYKGYCKLLGWKMTENVFSNIEYVSDVQCVTVHITINETIIT